MNSGVGRPIEEWSLFDHLEFVVGSWLLIGAAALLCGGTAYAMRLQAGGKGAAAALIRIGASHPQGLVEPLEDVAARLGSAAFLEALVRSKPDLFPTGPKGLALEGSVAPRTALVRVEASAPTPEAAVALARTAGERIAADHRPALEHLRTTLAQRLVETEQLVTAMEATLKQAAAAPIVTGDVGIQRALLLDQLTQLRREVIDLRVSSHPAMARKTELVDAPVGAIPPSGARRAGLLGLATGVAAGLLAAYVVKLRRRSRV